MVADVYYKYVLRSVKVVDLNMYIIFFLLFFNNTV